MFTTIPPDQINFHGKKITLMTRDELLTALTACFNAYAQLAQQAADGQLPSVKDFLDRMKEEERK